MQWWHGGVVTYATKWLWMLLLAVGREAVLRRYVISSTGARFEFDGGTLSVVHHATKKVISKKMQ